MSRIIIAGVETVAGRAISRSISYAASKQQLVESLRLTDRTTQPTRSESVFGNSSLTDLVAADTVVFCGGASVSSWDSDFGRFYAEETWLKQCVDAVRTAGARLIYVSSDAVFGGPWIFHDDNCSSYSDSSNASAIRRWESLAAKTTRHLIIRTNVIGRSEGNYLDTILTAAEADDTLSLDTGRWSTPLAESQFAGAFISALDAGVEGTVNIGGAERLTPFRFACHVVNAFDLTVRIEPLSAGTVSECGLRSHGLRQAVSFRAPVLNETLDCLIEAQDIIELAAAA